MTELCHTSLKTNPTKMILPIKISTKRACSKVLYIEAAKKTENKTFFCCDHLVACFGVYVLISLPLFHFSSGYHYGYQYVLQTYHAALSLPQGRGIFPVTFGGEKGLLEKEGDLLVR